MMAESQSVVLPFAQGRAILFAATDQASHGTARDQMVTLDQVLRSNEQLPVSEQLRRINLLAQRLLGHISDEDQPVDLLSTPRLGAELWQEIDSDAYLEQERDSWTQL
jgi:hypothetical protein